MKTDAAANMDLLGSEQLIQSVWERAVDAMVLSDKAGRVIAANSAYLTLYGFAREEVVGHSFAIIFPEDQREKAEADYRRLFDAPAQSPVVESAVRHSSGEERIVDVRYSIIEDGEARVAMLSVIRDVTERVRLQKAAQILAQQKDDFLLTVSHDLRTPLTTILGHTQFLLRSLQKSGRIDESRLEGGLRTIEATAGRMNRQIGELLDAASIQMGQPLMLRRSPMDLVALARRAVETAEGTTDEHTIVLHAPEEQVIGVWDETRLERVLDNLLANAIKYSPDGGTVTVSVQITRSAAGPQAQLRVTDMGVGIGKDDVARIFDRFYRAAKTRDRVSGMGIGLVGVRQIVDQHGGSITVESAEGNGSTFSVSLPLPSGDREQRSE